VEVYQRDFRDTLEEWGVWLTRSYLLFMILS